MSKHITEKVSVALIELDKRVGDVKMGFTEMVDQGNGYPLDTLAIGAIKRCVSQASAFKLLVEAENLMCARALLRLQIDNGLRFYAAFLVEDPHQFALEVLQGNRIDKIKDSDGIYLRDSYLVQKLKPDYPWLEEVYKITSGYIHLSDRAMLRPVSHINDEDRTVCIVISDRDECPEFSWVEVVECFNEATDIFLKYLYGWIHTKVTFPLKSGPI